MLIVTGILEAKMLVQFKLIPEGVGDEPGV